MAQEEVLFAHDFSGSTSNFGVYHRIAAAVGAEFPTAKFILWDNNVKEITRERFEEVTRRWEGSGGTYPAVVAKYIVEHDFHGHLVLMTDGEVSDVGNVDKYMNGWKFTRVTCHIVNNRPNLSVTCAFIRNSPSTVHSHTVRGEESTSTATSMTVEDLDVKARLDTINSLADWETTYAILEKAVIARTMGVPSDMPLRDMLLEFKKKLVRWGSSEPSKSAAVDALTEALEAFDWDAAVAAADTMTHSYYEGDAPAWSRQMDRLIAMCTGALRNAFSADGISAAVSRQAAVAPISAATVPAAEEGSTSGQFVCPVTLEAENDVVLLVKAGPPLLHAFPKQVVDDILVCPLNVLQYPDVVEALIARLDHPVSLRALKEAAAAGHADAFAISPLTREPLLGAITLGAHEEHVGASNWTLAALLNNGKLAGNMSFWIAALWLLVKEGRIPYLSGLVSQLEQHLKFRLKTCSSYASLLGTPEFVTTKVPLGVAVWYVLASPAVTRSPTWPDPLRAHIPHLDALNEIFCLTGFPLSAKCETHAARTRALLSLLAWVKRDNSTFRAAVKALYQLSCTVDAALLGEDVCPAKNFVPLVPLDGPAPAAQVAEVRSKYFSASCFAPLSADDIIGLASMVSPLLSAKDIVLSPDWTAFPEKAAVSWKYTEEAPAVKICLETCRPYTFSHGDLWTLEYEKVYHHGATECIPMDAYFCQFVGRYKRFPNAEELLWYVFRRCVVHGTKATLPWMIRQFVAVTFEEMAEVMRTITPEECAARYARSVDRMVRASLDGTAIAAVTTEGAAAI